MKKHPSELRYGDTLVPSGAIVISERADEQPDGTWCLMVRDPVGFRALADFENDEIELEVDG